MKIHKEGNKSIGITALLFAISNLISFLFISASIIWLSTIIFIGTLFLLLFIILASYTTVNSIHGRDERYSYKANSATDDEQGRWFQ